MVRSLPCYGSSRQSDLRRGHDDGAVDAGLLEQLSDREVLVRGARRRVDHEVVQRVPVHVLQELLDQACCSAAPAGCEGLRQAFWADKTLACASDAPFFLGPRQMTASSGSGSRNPTDTTARLSSA